MIATLIIDDEQAAHDSLKHHLTKHNANVNIQASAYNVAEGIAAIQQHQPDLVFLDIDMPDGTGFDLLKQIGQPKFQVIFVTAFNQYAQTAIRFGALDYLSKPVVPDELNNALLRAQAKQLERIQLQQLEIMQETLRLVQNQQAPKRISISTADGVLFFPVQEIIRLEAMQNYTRFVFKTGKKILASLNLKKFETDLKPFPNFMRIHKSHIIHLAEVARFVKGEKSYVELSNGTVLPVSRSKRAELLDRLNLIS